VPHVANDYVKTEKREIGVCVCVWVPTSIEMHSPLLTPLARYPSIPSPCLSPLTAPLRDEGTYGTSQSESQSSYPAISIRLARVRGVSVRVTVWLEARGL